MQLITIKFVAGDEIICDLVEQKAIVSGAPVLSIRNPRKVSVEDGEVVLSKWIETLGDWQPFDVHLNSAVVVPTSMSGVSAFRKEFDKNEAS